MPLDIGHNEFFELARKTPDNTRIKHNNVDSCETAQS